MARHYEGLKTWVEIDLGAAKHNYDFFRKLVGPKVKLWSVIKSNAYGHGLLVFGKLMNKFGIDGFCVDSVIEGLTLRKAGIKKPILVLGPTLPKLLGVAAKNNVTVTVSNFESLKDLARAKRKPNFHLKVDTGMHRQGFYLEDVPRLVKLLRARSYNLKPAGVYTHFASAKDINYPTYTDKQFKNFNEALKIIESSGVKNLIKHCAATGGTLLHKKYHSDAVRVGIGLYGLWPSKELEVQLLDYRLKPVLSWRTTVTEIKSLKKGDYVGYDLTYKARKPLEMAVLPVGYWHGFPRSLSGVGEVLVNGKPARVLGRVSMDLVVVDVSGLNCKPGDIATIIGKSRNIETRADEIALDAGTTHYEFLTRLNPLMERIII